MPDDLFVMVCAGLDMCEHLQLAQACPAFWGWYNTHWAKLYVLHGQFVRWRQLLPLRFCQRRSRHHFLLYAMSVYEEDYKDAVYGRAVLRYGGAQRRRWAPPQCAAAVRGRRCRRPPAAGRRFCAVHAQRPLPLVWPPIFRHSTVLRRQAGSVKFPAVQQLDNDGHVGTVLVVADAGS